MPRKSSSKSASTTTAKKFTTVPPKAAEAPKVAVSATPAPAISATKPVVATIPEKKIESTPVVVAAVKTETTPVVVAKTGCCQATAKAETACTERSDNISAAIESLHSTDANTARDAATTLGLLGDSSAVEPLVQALSNTCGFFHSVVRAAAAESLGTLADDRAIEPLLTAITDPIAEVSSEAIRAISAFNDERVVDALSDVVRNRVAFFLPIARRAAVFGLAKIGGDRATEILRSVAVDEFEDTTIRSAAETGLIREGTSSAK